jgi:hypothetical protein
MQHTILLVLIAVTAYAAAQPAYYPFGPQLNVSKTDLVGWKLCWNASYADEIDQIAVVQNCTDAPYLLMGCGPDPDEIQLLSVGKTSVILSKDFGQNTTDPFVYDNGAQWYYSTSWSWGFFMNGTVDAILDSCDYGVFNDTEYRLCWHVKFEGTDNGWRCGAIDGDVVALRRYWYENALCPILLRH